MDRGILCNKAAVLDAVIKEGPSRYKMCTVILITLCCHCLINNFVIEKVCQHEQEQAQLKERARRLERRLGTLDSEYAQQVENLRAAYQKTLSAGLERDVEGEENIRLRYQAEIEQLRVRISIVVFCIFFIYIIK